jgi:hypothetical protein
LIEPNIGEPIMSKKAKKFTVTLEELAAIAEGNDGLSDAMGDTLGVNDDGTLKALWVIDPGAFWGEVSRRARVLSGVSR